jgi:hypothetical protein
LYAIAQRGDFRSRQARLDSDLIDLDDNTVDLIAQCVASLPVVAEADDIKSKRNDCDWR